jgi:selenocysteine lyase/cysteine desulfurase
MRPLRALAAKDVGAERPVELTVVPCSPEGFADPADLEAALRPETVMIVLNHSSNVCGTLLPVREAGALARSHTTSSGKQCLLLVDTAQTAGAYPVDMKADLIDLLAFTGHKALGGPMGTGGLIIDKRVNLERLNPLKRGGTGSRSESETQPDFLPDAYESGTANTVGLAGLEAGVRWVLEQGINAIRQHEVELIRHLLAGLQEIPSVTVHGGRDASRQTATVSFNIEGMQPSEVGQRLDDECDLMCRVGLHCAPTAHRTMGTFPSGTVRFGLSAFSTLIEVDTALQAVEKIARRG